MLSKAEFAPQVYLAYEKSLVESGQMDDANDIYRRMKRRQWEADSHPKAMPESGWWPRSLAMLLIKMGYRLVYGEVMGFGTFILRPFIALTLALAVALWAIWEPADVQPSAARLAAAEVNGSQHRCESLCPDVKDWGAFDRGLHCAMLPIVDLLTPGDWEPREKPRSKRLPVPGFQ